MGTFSGANVSGACQCKPLCQDAGVSQAHPNAPSLQYSTQ